MCAPRCPSAPCLANVKRVQSQFCTRFLFLIRQLAHVLRRHGLDEPHAVAGAVKHTASRVQRGRLHGQQHGAAAALAHAPGGNFIGGEVHVVAAHFLQAFAPDVR
jgi:hypothetical protein